MFKVWYDIRGEYHEEFCDTIDEAIDAFDNAVDVMYTIGDHIEIDDNTGKVITWVTNGGTNNPYDNVETVKQKVLDS